jgi:hypothetical protein
LAEIEQGVVEAHQELSAVEPPCPAADGGQFDPADDVRPEVELVYHEAEDPFAEEFEEEEIVDQRTIPFCRCEVDGRAPGENRDLPITVGVGDAAPGPPNLLVVGETEESNPAVHPSVSAPEEDASGPDGDLTPADDRDMILIEEPHPEPSETTARTGRRRRQDYRRLFAQLRQRQA